MLCLLRLLIRYLCWWVTKIFRLDYTYKSQHVLDDNFSLVAINVQLKYDWFASISSESLYCLTKWVYFQKLIVATACLRSLYSQERLIYSWGYFIMGFLWLIFYNYQETKSFLNSGKVNLRIKVFGDSFQSWPLTWETKDDLTNQSPKFWQLRAQLLILDT